MLCRTRSPKVKASKQPESWVGLGGNQSPPKELDPGNAGVSPACMPPGRRRSQVSQSSLPVGNTIGGLDAERTTQKFCSALTALYMLPCPNPGLAPWALLFRAFSAEDHFFAHSTLTRNSDCTQKPIPIPIATLIKLSSINR
jgi:hypothetical protein